MKPSQDRIDELLARRPGGRSVERNPSLEAVESFLADQREQFPEAYREEPPALSAALSHKDSTMQHYVDLYADYFRKMGREPDMQNIPQLASQYAASSDLQREFNDCGGFVAFALEARAQRQGLIKILGKGR